MSKQKLNISDKNTCKNIKTIRTIDDIAESLFTQMWAYSENFGVQTEIIEAVFDKMLDYKKFIFALEKLQ